MCLNELEEIVNVSNGNESGGKDSCPIVPEVVQKSVVQLIMTARSALKSSQSPSEIDNSPSNVVNSVDNVSIERAQGGSKNCSNSKHVESQTDDISFIDPRVSMQPTEEPEIARLEVGNLRDTRMSLVIQRKDFSDRLKQVI